MRQQNLPKELQMYIFLAVFILCAAFAHANTPEDERREILLNSKETLCVNLGPDCFAAGYRYRKAAFPFDWVLSLDNERFLEILEDDFRYYLDPTYYGIHTNGAIIHTYYHLEFRHEHDNEFFAKYKRRIEPFRSLNTYQGKVVFLRRGYSGATDPSLYWPDKETLVISREWAFKLNDVLKKKFPSLNYYIGILNYPKDKNYYFQLFDRVFFFELDGDVHDLMEFMVETMENDSGYPQGVSMPVEISPKPHIRTSSSQS